MAAPLSREDSLGQMFLVGAGDGLYDTCKLSITSVIVIQQVFAIGNATLIHVWIRRLYVSVIEICLCPLLSWWQVSWPTGFLIPWMKLVRCQKSTIRLNVDIQHINTVCMRHSLYCESAGWMISISQPALAQYQWAKLVSAVLYMYTYVIRKWVFFLSQPLRVNLDPGEATCAFDRGMWTLARAGGVVLWRWVVEAWQSMPRAACH